MSYRHMALRARRYYATPLRRPLRIMRVARCVDTMPRRFSALPRYAGARMSERCRHMLTLMLRHAARCCCCYMAMRAEICA